ncbi:MAG: protein phosphatase 2C domain-containing protein [Sandaracinaceae bacterium]
MADPAATPPLRLLAAGDTHIGRREHNEDTILMRSDLSLYAVADGAGGHNAGNIASALATSTLAHHFESTQDEAASAPAYDEMGLSTAARRLAIAFQEANHEVIEVASTSEKRRGMGTTLVAAHFDLFNGSLVLGHVGDSRCYRLRDGRLEPLTQDHTLVNDVLELRPDLDRESARRLPRNVITNALGMDRTLRVSVRTHEVAAGDRYLLCSDGLTDEVDEGQIAQAIQLTSTPEEQVRLLIDLAAEGGARDNVAVILLTCSLRPGVAQVPVRPVAPTRTYPEASLDLDPILIPTSPAPAEGEEDGEEEEPARVTIHDDVALSLDDESGPVEVRRPSPERPSSGRAVFRPDSLHAPTPNLPPPPALPRTEPDADETGEAETVEDDGPTLLLGDEPEPQPPRRVRPDETIIRKTDEP